MEKISILRAPLNLHRSTWLPPKVIEVVKLLIAYGANINDDVYGITLLYFCSLIGRTDLVKIFFDAGATVDACNICKQTTLHLTAEQRHIKVVELLIVQRADKNICRLDLISIFGDKKRYYPLDSSKTSDPMLI